MRTYRDKEDLKNEIRQSFEKYISEFDTIPEALKDKKVPGVDRTPAENLAYQVGWTTLLLSWEADEKRGMDVETPSRPSERFGRRSGNGKRQRCRFCFVL